jgi:hypothetical protein
MDPTHPWISKAQHQAKSAANVGKVLRILGLDPSSENGGLLEFAASRHDLGRIIQALKDGGEITSGPMMALKDHGQYSVELLKEWGIPQILPDGWFLLDYTITHHLDVVQPPLAEGADMRQQWLYSCTAIIRVADKFTTMLNRTDHYLSPEGIAGDIALMEKECRHLDKPFYGEAGYINQEAFTPFSQRKPFLRADCSTYEAYIGAFYMGWLFDIEIPELIREIVNSGFVEKILGYLRSRNIPPEQMDIVQNTVSEYLKANL